MPRTVVGSKTPLQAMRDWHKSHPHLFVKSPRNHTGRDTYPVHDCLLVKISDKEVALNTLFSVMVTHLSYQPSVDIAYYNEEGTKIEELVTGQGSTRLTYPDLDDPFSVVQEVSPVHFPVEDLSSYPLIEDYP